MIVQNWSKQWIRKARGVLFESAIKQKWATWDLEKTSRVLVVIQNVKFNCWPSNFTPVVLVFEFLNPLRPKLLKNIFTKCLEYSISVQLWIFQTSPIMLIMCGRVTTWVLKTSPRVHSEGEEQFSDCFSKGQRKFAEMWM